MRGNVLNKMYDHIFHNVGFYFNASLSVITLTIILLQAKESYKKMVVSHRSVPEVEHLLKEEHDTGTHSVEIVELSTNELAQQNNWIGVNQVGFAIFMIYDYCSIKAPI